MKVHRELLFALLFLTAAIPLFGLLGPQLEARFLPILANVTDEVSVAGPVIIVETEFDKRRVCPVEIAVVDFLPDGGYAVEAITEGSFNRSNGGRTRLERRFTLSDETEAPGVLRRTLHYRCHPFWLTPHTFTPLRVD